MDGNSDSESEDFLQGIVGAAYSETREPSSGVPLHPTPINTPTQLDKGDHILFQTPDSLPPMRPLYQSALVTSIEGKDIGIISYSRGGIYEDFVEFSAFVRLHRVNYSKCKYSATKSVSRAKWRLKSKEDHYHAIYNNSHFFVTWAKTGSECLLYDIIDGITCDEGQHYPLNPVLSFVPVTSLSDINPGDHLTNGSQHYLVDKVSTAEPETYTAYTTSSGKVCLEEKTLGKGGAVLRVDYDQQSNSYHPGDALVNASKELKMNSKWESSDSFVTKMKCGKAHVITDKCLLSGSLEPVGCTLVTPNVSVDIGDHLVVRKTFGDYSSVLVYNCVDTHTVVSMPCLHTKGTMGRLDIRHYNEVYRVNYPQSLPVGEILRRCSSPEGEQMALESGGDASCFVTWAKIGKQLPVNIKKLIDKQQLAQIRPFQYEKILSVDEIEVGDHLFVSNLAYRWHFLVTEKTDSEAQKEPLFNTIYCLRGSVKESKEALDPINDDIFRVMYPEEFPPAISARQARSLIGKVNLSPTARMWFVRWAKTGSEEGLEIDFLKRKSQPVLKSRILCFSQLDPGDYLVLDKGRFFVRRHYLVIGIESPNACTVIGTWKGKVQESRLSLDDGTYHKLIYEEGVCISTDESIQKAKELVSAPFSPKLFRRRFVNYVKTTDSIEIDVENLPEDRLLLQRERVESTFDLKPGDHIETPVKSFQKVSYRSAIVTSNIDNQKVMVICENPHGGGNKLVEMEWEISGETEFYRVKYLERMGVTEGLQLLRTHGFRLSGGQSDALMLATVGQAVSIQVDPQLHKLLESRKEDIRRPPSTNKARSLSIENGARASVNIAFKFGSSIILHGTRLGQVVGYGPGISLLAEAPFFTRRLYKLSRQRKFDQISEEDYKRGVIQQSFTSANMVVGATAGAIIGQVVIPIPVLGAAVGGAVGTISGNGFGRLEGWAASKLVRDGKVPSLPVVINMSFVDFPEN